MFWIWQYLVDVADEYINWPKGVFGCIWCHVNVYFCFDATDFEL